MRISEEFESIKSLLFTVLKNYPETRSDDTLLYLTCCEVLGAKNLAQAKELPISIISVHKMRQIIQNKEGLFKPEEKVENARRERNIDAIQYMRKQKKVV